MLYPVLNIIWLLIPAAVANAMPVIAARYKWLPTFNKPIDAHMHWRSQRLLGDHKTVRGFIIGIIFGSTVAIIQHQIVPFQISISPLLFGAVTSFCALGGDAMKSLLKRQLAIMPGHSWRPWDQIDYVVGALLGVYAFTSITLFQIVFAVLFFGLLSFCTSAIGYKVRVKKTI